MGEQDTLLRLGEDAKQLVKRGYQLQLELGHNRKLQPWPVGEHRCDFRLLIEGHHSMVISVLEAVVG